jgi:hypothetical protein
MFLRHGVRYADHHISLIVRELRGWHSPRLHCGAVEVIIGYRASSIHIVAITGSSGHRSWVSGGTLLHFPSRQMMRATRDASDTYNVTGLCIIVWCHAPSKARGQSRVWLMDSEPKNRISVLIEK